MEIGSGQFEEIYGKTSKCSDRIEEARNRFRDTFSHIYYLITQDIFYFNLRIYTILLFR